MGYPLQIASRYLSAKSKGAFVSVSTALAIVGVALGVAVLLTVMSVTGGFQTTFQEKVLGVNAHVIVMKHTSFREYRDVVEMMRDVPGIVGVSPFTISPMMVSHKEKTATGVLVKGVDPATMPTVLDLPTHIVEGGSLDGLRRPGAEPPPRRYGGSSRPLGPAASTGAPRKPLKADVPTESAGEERDSAGRNLPLLRAIEDSIREFESDTAIAEKRDNSVAKSIEELGDIGDVGGIDEILAIENREDDPGYTDGFGSLGSVDGAIDGAIVGPIAPEGGYKSVLPDPEDDLPDDVAPDPCNSQEARAGLPGIVVGITLAKSLNASIGDCLQVTSPTIGFSYSGGAIRPPIAKQFKVIALFDAGFDQYDSKLVYVDLFESQVFHDYGDSVTGVEAKVNDIDKASAIKRSVASRLSPTLYTTMDWEDLNRSLFTALRLQKILMSVVLAVIIFVAAFGVVATLIMLVLEKRKEIAVLKAMGASDVAILRIFVYQGGLIGVIGTALGLGLGLAVCKGLLVYGFPLDPKVYFISSLPVDVRPTELFLTGAIALALCLVATVIPSLYAARLRPADGVRAD